MWSRRLPANSAPNDWSVELQRRRDRGAPLLDLTDQNPTRTGLSEAGAAIAAFAAHVDPGAARYEPDPRGLIGARQAIARYYAERGLEVHADDLALVTGTSEAYSTLFRALCDPGDRVLVPAPGYPLLGPLASLDAVEAAAYPLVLERRWRPDLAAIERLLRPPTRAIVVIQPNHPTGSCFDSRERAALDALCAAHDVAIIADEVFGDFLWADAAAGPEPSLLGPCAAPTFVLQGLSKLCGLPQLKLSWIAIAGPEAARAQARAALEWIGDAYLAVGTPVQMALPRLLERRHAFRARVLERVSAQQAALVSALATTGAEVLPAEGGWTALVRLPSTTGAESLALRLLRDGVVVHPGHFYDFDDDQHLAISLIVEPGVMADGAQRLAAALRRG